MKVGQGKELLVYALGCVYLGSGMKEGKGFSLSDFELAEKPITDVEDVASAVVRYSRLLDFMTEGGKVGKNGDPVSRVFRDVFCELVDGLRSETIEGSK